MSKKIKAGEAEIQLGVKSMVQAGLDKAAASMKNFGRRMTMIGASVTAAGGAVMAPMLGMAKSFASAGDDIHKAGQRVAVGARELSSLAFAAEQGGAGLNEVEKGFFGLGRTMLGARQGLTTSIDALAELGLTWQQLEGQSPVQQMMMISDQMAKFRDEAKLGAIAQAVFGRTGRQLVPMLKDGSAAVRDLQEEAHRLGITMSQDDADAAAEFTDAMNRLNKTMAGVKNQIGAALAPALSATLDWVIAISTGVRKWIKDNRELFVLLLKGSAAVIALGGALTGLGLAAITAGAALSTLSAIIGFMVSPIGAVAAAVITLGVIIQKNTDFMGQAWQWAKERFGDLVATFQDGITIIVGALQDGDMAAAWDATLKVMDASWLDLTNGLRETWDSAMTYVTKAGTWAATGIGKMFDKLGDALKKMLDAYKSYYNSVYNFTVTKLGELSGVQTIGGSNYDAFGSLGVEQSVTNFADGMKRFGNTMADTAMRQGEASLQARKEAAEGRKLRLQRLREELKVDADERRKALAMNQDMPSAPVMPTDIQRPEQSRSAGTFSAFAARYLGGQNPADQTARNTARMVQQNDVLIAQGRQPKVAVMGE